MFNKIFIFFFFEPLSLSFYRSDFLYLSFLMFFIGLVGVFVMGDNIFIILISLELLFLSIIFNLILFSIGFDDVFGILFSIILLTIIAVESSVSLAVIVVYFRLAGLIEVDFLNKLKG